MLNTNEQATIAVVTQMGKMNTRDRIISAAKEEFFSKGYDATRMRSIADRAEINKGLLHYYFKTKEALMLEVFQGTFKDFFRTIEEATIKDQEIFTTIHTVVDLYIDHMMMHPKLPSFIISEMNRDPMRHFNRMRKAAIKPPFNPLLTQLERAQKEGKVRGDVDPLQFMIHLISMTLFPFLAKNMLTYMHGMTEKEFETFLRARKQAITQTLIASLKE